MERTMENTIRVRVGTIEDLDSIMALAMMGTEENGFIRPNVVKLLSEIYPALQCDNGIMGVIGEVGGQAEAAVLLRVGTMWYADGPVLEEKAVFVHPDYRSAKGGRASRLVEFSKHVSDSIKMPLIIGILSNHRTRGKVKMYQRHFGEPTGAFFLYNARTGLTTEG